MVLDQSIIRIVKASLLRMIASCITRCTIRLASQLMPRRRSLRLGVLLRRSFWGAVCTASSSSSADHGSPEEGRKKGRRREDEIPFQTASPIDTTPHTTSAEFFSNAPTLPLHRNAGAAHQVVPRVRRRRGANSRAVCHHHGERARGAIGSSKVLRRYGFCGRAGVPPAVRACGVRGCHGCVRGKAHEAPHRRNIVRAGGGARRARSPRHAHCRRAVGSSTSSSCSRRRSRVGHGGDARAAAGAGAGGASKMPCSEYDRTLRLCTGCRFRAY